MYNNVKTEEKLEPLPRWSEAKAAGWKIGTFDIVYPPIEYIVAGKDRNAIYIKSSINGVFVLVPHYYFVEYVW